MYSYNGDVVINGEKYEDGKEALARLQDYGCLHFKTDVILGVSEPRYDKAELEKQKAKDKELIEYDGRKKTTYEWQQGARRLEAETRRQRDISFMAKQSGDKILERNANEKISFYRAKYDDLCDKVGIEKRYNRMGVTQLKGVDKIEKSDIIEKKKDSTHGRYSLSQDKINKILTQELKGVSFSKDPIYNPKIRCNGKTTIALNRENKVLYIERIEIGKQDSDSIEFLIDTLIHEELEARIALRSNKSEKYNELYHFPDFIRHSYIDNVIQRFFKIKGWGHNG